MNVQRSAAACLAFSIICLPATADWPNFRGPNHDGVASETGIRTKWDGPIPVKWERELGSAFSSFAVVDGVLFTCGTKNDMQVLYALDAKTGATRWEVPFEKAFRDSYGDGTRATPTVSDNLVYVQGGHGRLFCADARNGKEVWSRQFSATPTWGYSGSVLIHDNLAIAMPGKSGGAVAAFDRKTGKEVWKRGDEQAGYSTPYPFSFGGKNWIVGFTGASAMIVDANTGGLGARIPWSTSYAVNAAAPIYREGFLFLTSGYNTGAALMKLSAKGSTLEHEQVWKSRVLLNKFQSCLLHEGHLYTSDQKALKCVEFTSGEEKWSIPRVKHGTLVLNQGHLFLLTEKGELQIGKADPSGFSPSTRTKILSGKCWTVPVLDGGMLYARSLNTVICLDMRE